MGKGMTIGHIGVRQQGDNPFTAEPGRQIGVADGLTNDAAEFFLDQICWGGMSSGQLLHVFLHAT